MITRTLLLLLFVLPLLFAQTVNAQRDHLTPQEVDLVKDAQALDKRIEVFIKAADRRLLVLNGGTAVVANTKQAKKEAALWGDLPTGSRAELISDIAKILDEAITNIDDVSARDERNPLIAKSLRRLAQAVNTIMEQVKPMSTTAKGEAEIATFEELNENAQSILEAANKLPPPEVEKKTKTKSN
jgi:acyl-CoA reductase-like NAD-dependent aldehyde dehydrogenase